MIRLWLFLHILGFTLWIGGALAAMVAGIAARREFWLLTSPARCSRVCPA